MKNVVKLVLCSLLVLIITGCKKEVEERFYFEDEYYENSSLLEIEKEYLDLIIKDKQSFGVFIYQPLCSTSANFEEVLNNFINNNQMVLYKIEYSDIKDTDLGKKIKYYPSFIIYKDGEIIDYLEADKDEDVKYYDSEEGFKSWISKYVFINEKTNTSNNSSETKINKDLKIDVEIDNISYDENKVNIYLFWGNGCPHCEHAISYIESLENEYGKYFTLNKFEVWYDEENQKICELFASKMGDSVRGVPYIIIGEKSFSGFSEKYKQSILDAIISQYKNSYDVYFDNRK